MNQAKYLFIWLLPAVLLLNIIYSSDAWGEGINFRGEFTYFSSDNETTDKRTGQTATGENSQFLQQYNFDFSKNIYPYLTLAGGTLYELNNSTSTFQGIEVETDEKILRPYVDLRLDNPVYGVGADYNRFQRENKATGSPVNQDFRDEFNTFLRLRPSGLPELNLRWTYTDTYDDPETVNSTRRQLNVDSQYAVWGKLRLKYFYSRDEDEDNIEGFTTLSQSHTGNMDYADNFFNQRLSMSTGYRIRYTTFEFPATANVESPLLRSAGLSSLDNTPEDGPALDPNSALIDGNLTASAGIDIGLAGDETTLTNIGLDFGFPVDVDKIYIWVDRSLSSSVANSFSWSIYTSPDNTDTSTWTLHETVSPGFFGTFENRFEISFTKVETRFIKVVTRPLSPLVPDAALFTNILVTEMQAFITLSGVDFENKFTDVDHNYNLSLNGRLSDKATLGYSLFYRLQEQDPSSTRRTEMSNGLYFNYVFNRIFTARTSFSQADNERNDMKSVQKNYAASLKAAYMKTLTQNLTYSGTKTTAEEGSSSTNSLFLRTNADLYKGWSAFFDVGYNWDEPLSSAKTTSTTFRTGTNIVPNNKFTINMNYSVTQTQESDGETGQTYSRSEWDINAFWVPFRALSFNARVNVLDRGDKTATLYNYSVNWSPFLDGTLQLYLVYNETLRPEDEIKNRTIGPSLKWIISRHFLLDMYYSVSQEETRFQETESNGFRMNLRINF